MENSANVIEISSESEDENKKVPYVRSAKKKKLKEKNNNKILTEFNNLTFEIESNRNNIDSNILIDEKNSSNSFFFKCNRHICNFLTKSKTDFITHLSNHQNGVLFIPKSSEDWQECFHCKYLGTNILNLIDHIDTEHRMINSKNTTFCNNSEIDGICNEMYENENEIPICENITIDQIEKDVKKEIYIKLVDYAHELLVSMKKHVKPIKCQDCNESYFIIEEYLLHQQFIHSKPLFNIVKQNKNIKLFSCIFCGFDGNDQDEIIKHMSNFHTRESRCFCARVMNRRSVLSGRNSGKSSTNLSIICLAKDLDEFLDGEEPAFDDDLI